MLGNTVTVLTIFILGALVGIWVGAQYCTKKYNGRPIFIGPDGQGLDNGTYQFDVENREKAMISVQRFEKHGPVDTRRIIILGTKDGHTHSLPEVFNEDRGVFSFTQEFNNPKWQKINPFAHAIK
jgi:hypothetical protein